MFVIIIKNFAYIPLPCPCFKSTKFMVATGANLAAKNMVQFTKKIVCQPHTVIQAKLK